MNGDTSILSAKAQLLQTWGLRETPPFRGVPPVDIKELMQVFVDRGEELRRTILTLDEGENVLIRGMTGIGKTTFIMVVLHQMHKESETLRRPILPVHIRQFAGQNRNDFYRVVLYGLAKRLSIRYKRAKSILQALTGEKIDQGRSQELGGDFEVKIPPLITLTGKGIVGKEDSKSIAIDYPEHFVDELLSLASKSYRHVVIAVDDIERSPSPATIKTMLESSLDLIRDPRCSFVLTGKPLTVLEDMYASGLDIFNEQLTLGRLTNTQLREIAIRTLNIVRYHPRSDSVEPFEEDVIEAIASKSLGIPRRFVLICGKILRLAVEHNERKIDMRTFEAMFEKYQDEWAEMDLPPDIRRILYIGVMQNGFSLSKDARLEEVYRILGISTLRQFVDFADSLVQMDLLERLENERGDTVYRITPEAEKLAATGKPEIG